MTEPENFTAAQASDPSTPGQVLADIAALRPDLRVAVASNPSAYPGLLEWLKGLGEPAIDAAIAARSTVAPTQQMPVQPPMPPAGPQVPPAPAWAQGATQPQPPTSQPQPQPPYGAAPAGPPAGLPPQGYPQPGGLSPAGAPPQGMPPHGYPQPGYPQPGGLQPGGLQYGQPPKKSNTGLVIVLVILGVLVLLGVGAFLVIRAVIDKGEDIVDTAISSMPTVASDEPPGDDPELDALWTQCANEDWQACDDLFDQAEPGTAYYDFADTCGNKWTAGTQTYCVDAMNPDADTDTDTGTDTDTDTDTGALSPAETLYLDALKTACGAENWSACETLYVNAPLGSDYEAFGDTCGGRIDGGATCVLDLGDGTYPTTNAYGDDPGLDALQDACGGGDADACTLLYSLSPGGSEYEAFAESHS